ncbi:hypothetical protein [Erwinia amylovora]
MCIRDRRHRVFSTASWSVSYTHLDVYKRQASPSILDGIMVCLLYTSRCV